jgi:serine/threonine protein phosphatase 1
MKTYVVPDIHGAFDLMIVALDAIPKGSKIVFLGDYIDRGPKSAQVILHIRSGIASGENWIALKGNHEDFMASAIVEQDKNYAESWVLNGGAQCIDSYGGITDQLFQDAKWAKGLPLYHKDAHRVYVHAYAPRNEPIESASDHELMWTRYPKGADVGHMGMHVVHGHTPQANGPELYANRTNLDCGAVFTGRLVVGVFDDSKAGGPVDLLRFSL